MEIWFASFSIVKKYIYNNNPNKIYTQDSHYNGEEVKPNENGEQNNNGPAQIKHTQKVNIPYFSIANGRLTKDEIRHSLEQVFDYYSN